ncbi:hypothetical protein [Scatolibacter rhodanostii]|nr:hypothetical protein [Scatolibacter rhodanostii]
MRGKSSKDYAPNHNFNMLALFMQQLIARAFDVIVLTEMSAGSLDG